MCRFPYLHALILSANQATASKTDARQEAMPQAATIPEICAICAVFRKNIPKEQTAHFCQYLSLSEGSLPFLSIRSSSFTSKFTSEKPFLATFTVLVLVITVVYALAVVQLIHESLAFLEVFLLCLVLLAGVVASLVA
jgi:hypothetical protein